MGSNVNISDFSYQYCTPRSSPRIGVVQHSSHQCQAVEWRGAASTLSPAERASAICSVELDLRGFSSTVGPRHLGIASPASRYPRPRLFCFPYTLFLCISPTCLYHTTSSATARKAISPPRSAFPSWRGLLSVKGQQRHSTSYAINDFTAQADANAK